MRYDFGEYSTNVGDISSITIEIHSSSFLGINLNI